MNPPARLLISRPGHIYLASYSNSSFTISLDLPLPGDPSWLALAAAGPNNKNNNLLYTSDEALSTTYLLGLDLVANSITEISRREASRGVCHLELNKEHTRMVGSAYGNGTVDIWHLENGRLDLIRTIRSGHDAGVEAHPHQAVLDPTGRFFVVNDLGTDSLLLLDSESNFNIVQHVRTPAGSGPRHGVFFPVGISSSSSPATHYILLCEKSNRVIVFSLEYTNTTINFTTLASYSTLLASNSSPGRTATAAAGQIILSPDSKHIYTSNRLTGDPADTIAHFRVLADEEGGLLGLRLVGETSTGGRLPRMFSMSRDGRDLLVANEQGEWALAALRRREDGSLEEEMAAGMRMVELVKGEEGECRGPKFVLQIA